MATSRWATPASGDKPHPNRLLRSSRVSPVLYFKPSHTPVIRPVYQDDDSDEQQCQESRTETLLKSLDIEYDNTIHYSDIALVTWMRCVYHCISTILKLVTVTVLILTILQLALPDWNFDVRELVGVTTIHTSLAWFVCGCFTRMNTVRNPHLGRSIAWVRQHRVRQMARAVFIWTTALLSTIMAIIAVLLRYTALDDDTNLDDIGVGRPHPETWLTRAITVEYTCGLALAIPVIVMEVMEIWWFCITARQFKDPRGRRGPSPEESRLVIDEPHPADEGTPDQATAAYKQGDMQAAIILGTVADSAKAPSKKKKKKGKSREK